MCMYRTIHNQDRHLCTAHWNSGGVFVFKMTLLFITSRSGEKAIFQVFDLLSLSGRILSLGPGGYSKTEKLRDGQLWKPLNSEDSCVSQPATQACQYSLWCSHSRKELKCSLNLELFQTLKQYADFSILSDMPAAYHSLVFYENITSSLKSPTTRPIP